jgi:hypothetical protein
MKILICISNSRILKKLMKKIIYLQHQNTSLSFNTQICDKWLLVQFTGFKTKYYAITKNTEI